ncbi:MAG: 50S ribosomal protein L10 [Rickettsiales bacterium]|nr:50S ribosomal protein L10 [Rickettsiales bacterium]|tara:strand:- start:776 stop:1285 length:510 start_codon:yes stop_codon:yes gene_type:complete
MDRAQKVEWVEGANDIFNGAEVVLITQYKGLSVAKMSELRGEIRKAGASFKVTKNRLAKRALEGTKYEPLADMFTGPTAMAWADEPVAAAKAIAAFAKENEKLVLVGGAFGEHMLDEAGIKQLATMPSLDELRGKIVALLNTPATNIAGVLQAPAGQVARVIGAYGAQG